MTEGYSDSTSYRTIECPCCLEDILEGDLTCSECGIALPSDWAEVSSTMHTVQPRERIPAGYDPYEEVYEVHKDGCGCTTCLNLSGRPYGPYEKPSFLGSQKDYHGVPDPDNPDDNSA